MTTLSARKVSTLMSELNPQETYLRSNKIEALDSIRGLAAFLIVLFHLPKFNPILNIGFVDNGYLMVELFFVVSGFVIFNVLAGFIQFIWFF